ncbi:MAG TPA: TlpA disulfide reductase family protein [Beijerinckiaceae bacterium]
MASRTRLIAAGSAALGLAGLAAALYGTGGLAGNSTASACAADKGAVARMASLARGEVAAVAVPGAPKPLPEIAFQGPDGEAKSLADFRGKTLLVNLWATWCAPCRREMPALDKLQAELGGDAFEVVAISLDTRGGDKPRAWLKENGIERLAFHADPQGRLLPVLQRSGHVVGLPTSILVGPTGCEIGVLKGPAEWASPDAMALVKAALGR